MQCPTCDSSDLRATKLEEGLPVYGCGECDGALLSLLYYRDWAEKIINDSVENDSGRVVVSEGDIDTHKTLCCPKCSRIMTKYSVSGCSGNRLDLCASCDEAWLDGGEWQLLKALQLSKILPTVFTDSWQNKVKKEQSDSRRKERFTKIVGNVDINKAEEIRSWLNSHNKRTELLFYISHE